MTAVDLRGSAWPVLRFWDRYRLADNDWGRLEVSTDGNSWSVVYGAAGLRPDWAEQSIDLSPWKNQGNLRIRFRLLTDGGTTEDGWSIDQLGVVEHTPVPVVLPFQEGFEGDLSRWLHAGWSLTDQQPYAPRIRATCGRHGIRSPCLSRSFTPRRRRPQPCSRPDSIQTERSHSNGKVP